MNNKKSLIVTFAIVLFIIFELATFIPSSIRYLFAVLSNIILVLTTRVYTQRKSIVLFSIFIFINLFYMAFDRGHLLKQDILIYFILFTCILISQTFNHISIKHIKYIVYLVIALILYSTINSIIIGIEDPMAIRTYAFGVMEDRYEQAQAVKYLEQGLMTYFNAHMLSCFPPILVYLALKATKYWKKVFLFLFAMTLIYLFALMVVTTSFITSLICSLVVFFIYSESKLDTSIVQILLVFIICYILYVVNAFDLLMQNDTFADKITDINLISEGHSVGHVQARQSLYNQTTNLISENPILGLAKLEEIGDHSFFLDFFALYGIFSLVFWWAWYEAIRAISNTIKFEQKNIIWMCITPIVFLIMTKSRVFAPNYFFATLVLCPLFVKYISLKAKR